MIPYILYTALLLTICFCFYQLLLQRETFYRLNRFILIGSLVLSFILPFVQIPQTWSFQKQREVNTPIVNATNIAVPSALPLPAQTSQNEVASAINNNNEKMLSSQKHPLQWLLLLYWIGVVIFAVNFLLQLAFLFYQRFTRPVICDGNLRIVEIKGNKAPCSFGQWIFINPEKYDYDTYTQILDHEKVHSRGYHSVDIVLSELAVVFQWFNPFCWLYRKSVETNLEYLTDNNLLISEKVEKLSYQMNLLKVSIPHLPLSLTTNYNQSLLKKRFMMMDIKKSNLHTSWKYAFLPVVFAVMVCIFNDPIVHSQKVVAAKHFRNNPSHLNAINIEKEGSWFATIKKDTVFIEFKATDDRSFNNSSFLINEFNPPPSVNVSEFSLKRQAGTMTFKGRFEGDQGMGKYQFSPDENYKSFLKQKGISDIEDQDMLAFFLINVKREYVEALHNNGYTEISKGELMAISALGIDESFIKMWKGKGYNDIAIHDLITLKALHVDPNYLTEVRDAGLKDVSISELISLKAQGISPTEIRKMAVHKSSARQTTNVEPVSFNQVIAGHHLEVDSTYVEAIRALGYDDLSNEQLWAMKNLNVKPEFIKAFQQIGYKDIPMGELMGLKSQNITPDYIQSFQKLGYPDIPLSQAVAFKSLNITPEYIESFQKLGYKDIPLSEIIGMHQAGVSPNLIEQYKNVGVRINSPGDIIAAKFSGVTPEYIRSMNEKGFKFKELSRYQQLKHLSENQ
jgi:hypothetical protein